MNDLSFWQFAVRYAGRNLLRRKRRTIMTVAGVSFAVTVSIVADRYAIAVMQLWEDGAADTGTAHAQMHAAGYRMKAEGVDSAFTLQFDNALEQRIRNDPNVLAMSRRLAVEGLIATASQSLFFLGKGVEPSEQLVSPRLFTVHDEGQFISDNDLSGIAVGKGLAESLNLSIGDEVALLTQTIDGSANAIDAHIIGIVDVALPSFSKRTVYAHISLLQKLIRLPESYTELAIRLRPQLDSEAWVGSWRKIAAENSAELHGWWELEPVIRNVGRIWNSAVMLISSLLFLSTSLSVINTIAMLITERKAEIAMLRALGAKRRTVRFLFILEAGCLGFLGGAIGAVLGNFVVTLMGFWGVPFRSPFDAGTLRVFPAIDAVMTLTMLVVAMAVCMAAGGITSQRKAYAV